MRKPIFNHKEFLHEVIRVDHAGEYGAKRIYSGQLSSTKLENDYKIIEEMREQELVHLKFFEDQIKAKKIRPTALMPIWHGGGFILGKISALLGTKYSMICTDSVENVIESHYEEQISSLDSLSYKDLKNSIQGFKDDESHHKEIAQNYIGQMGVKDNAFYALVKYICKVAIAVSKKL
jgi:3-demethoxyubiquinol 3-hydroxylase